MQPTCNHLSFIHVHDRRCLLLMSVHTDICTFVYSGVNSIETLDVFIHSPELLVLILLCSVHFSSYSRCIQTRCVHM